MGNWCSEPLGHFNFLCKKMIDCGGLNKYVPTIGVGIGILGPYLVALFREV